jgi:hypothetical protein
MEEKDLVKIMFEDLFTTIYDERNSREKKIFDFVRTISESMARYNTEMRTKITNKSQKMEA